MAKYVVIADKGDIFTKEFDSAEAAIKEVEYQWHHLTERERKQQRVYVLESQNPDEDADDHLDGNPIWEMEYYRGVFIKYILGKYCVRYESEDVYFDTLKEAKEFIDREDI